MYAQELLDDLPQHQIRKYNGKVILVIIETGGHFDKAGRDFIDKLASSQQDAHQ